jgi:hypothetical protein
MASMPHYMSQGVNHMTANGIDKAVHGLMEMVTMSITGVEEIVVFVIGMMTNTYLCLITLAVSGSLEYGINLLTNANSQLNSQLKSIGNDIQSEATKVVDEINKLVQGINTNLGIGSPTIDFSTMINALDNISLPSSLNSELQTLNKSIPTFADVQNITESIIRLPFEDLKILINQTMGNYTFNESLFPVPDKKALTFCSDNNDINDFFDQLVKIAHTARVVFIVVLTIAAILCCIPMAWWEILRWKRLQQRVKMISTEATDPIDAVYMVSRPCTSTIGRMIANKFSTPRRQIIARWAVAYPTSLPALFILALGLAGLFSCLCQYILLKSIEREIPILTNEIVNFTSKVVGELNNASMSWANGVNNVVMDTSNDINTDLLGWVNTSTTAVNNTLNTFVEQTMDVLNQTFGNTPLYGPITGVFNCLIELKVQGIQKALTWVHDKAHISVPTIRNDTFSLGAIAKMTNNGGVANFLANPSSTASDDISAIVNGVTNIIAATIKQEAIISVMILVIWLLLVIVSLVRAWFLFAGRDKLRGEAGNQYITTISKPVEFAHDQFHDPSPPRPQSAAPPYSGVARDPDVNQHAPYTLNPHPFPRPSNDHDNNEKPTSSDAWPFTRQLVGQPTTSRRDQSDENEKSGFI